MKHVIWGHNLPLKVQRLGNPGEVFVTYLSTTPQILRVPQGMLAQCRVNP